MNTVKAAIACRSLRLLRLLLSSVGIMVAASAMAEKPPYIAYAYPSGGQRGTTFEVEIGGQSLDAYAVDYIGGFRGLAGVNAPDFDPTIYVSGDGVEVKVTSHFRQLADRGDRPRIRNRQQKIEQTISKATPQEQKLMQQELDAINACWQAQKAEDRRLRLFFKNMARKQFNPQLSERLTVTVSIAPDAPSGEREMRLMTKYGLSNPIYFHVGALPETKEKEPNDDHQAGSMIESLPSLVNGQVFPGDIDHFSFKVHKGQQLVINAYARKLIPYMADAVPGWFQAVLSLYDENGKEVAYVDDYKNNPDPVLFHNVTQNGTYTLKIHDAIYRGRQDFVYRIEIGELPFITSIFPLGGRKGSSVEISLKGKNLPQTSLSGVMPQDSPPIRQITLGKEPTKSNPMLFAVGDLPEFMETEPNSGKAAHQVRIPVTVNGRIGEPGDWDTYAFAGKRGQKVVIEVQARSLGSVLDSIVKLLAPNGSVVAENDDYVETDGFLYKDVSGLNTHHADSYLIRELPADGIYYVYIGDAQAKGSDEHAYRMRISPALPDYNLRLDPSGINIAPGGTAAFSLNVMRLDGFNGPIKLETAGLPDGFEMSTDTIPAGENKLRFTLTAPRQIPEQMVHPKIIGMASFGGRTLRHEAVPVDNAMQAFLYRHLVPAQEIVLARSDPAPFTFSVSTPTAGLRLPINKEVYVKVTATRNKGVKMDATNLKFVLDNPPQGITLTKGGLSLKKSQGGFSVKADDSLTPGTKATLIVNGVSRRGRVETYYPIPAVPIQIVGGSSPGSDEPRVAKKK